MNKEKIKRIFFNLEENFIAILLAFMVILVFVATIGRYTKLLSLPFADELSRYCMIWLIFIGISAGAKQGAHFEVTAAVNKLPITLQKVVGCLKTCIVIAFNLTVSYYSLTLITNAMKTSQTSPALNIPMWIVYMALPLGCVLMSVSYGIHEFSCLCCLEKHSPSDADGSDDQIEKGGSAE